ncbi:AI-2E family transporter [Nocardioides panaciterrulae]|uniref:Putative PurR-regulated permease PerM n=1 Tax=Nocardioides panaciterrulae TaxID=661492 RepID=A0A7Y9E5G5_9ACTN|nr:putative PurR-regulated permease PerM [Nocardioides panaciterrulae]
MSPDSAAAADEAAVAEPRRPADDAAGGVVNAADGGAAGADPAPGADTWRSDPDQDLGEPGAPLSKRSPFLIGFFAGLGLFLAWWLGGLIISIGSVLIQILVALFLAAGLNPAVELFERRGLKRSWAVLTVIVVVVAALALFLVAFVPVISDQVAAITANAPDWLDSLQRNRQIQNFDQRYDVISKVKAYLADGKFASSLFGGVLGIGLAVLGVLANTFVVTVLTLYFLSSLEKTKNALYRLAPASRRGRVSKLGDEIIRGVGGYVSGAFVVALCAGISSLVFLFVVGLGQYAVALAFVVALLDVIPMIGATLGAVIVTAIGFATDPTIGLVCIIFYVVYQQLENYVIYPRVMSRSVDIPGAMTVIAALIGAALLGVVGALLAIPTAAAILLLTREVFVRRQDAR